MKIKKLLPQELLDATLEYKVYKKVLKNLLTTMEKEHNTPETATQFLVKTDYEFSDKKGKKLAVLIPGKQAGAWMVYAKAQVKTDKKMTSLGECYLDAAEDGTKVIKLSITKGSAKKAQILKQLNKLVLKPLGVAVAIVGSLAEENTVEESSDQEEGRTTDGDSEGSPEKAELTKTVQQISKVNKAINLKDGLDEEDMQKAETLKKLIRRFASILKSADTELRKEFGEIFLKTKKLYKKIELEIERLKSEGEDDDLDAALDEMLGDSGIQVSKIDNKEAAIKENLAILDEMNRLAEELNLFELA